MAENRVYGIDLGTTYSCVAHVDEHGKPVVVPNSNHQLTTPSVVYFEAEDKIVVGEHARDVAEMYPDRVVSTVKRVMGNPDWEFSCDGKTYTPQEISSYILRKVVADAEATTGDTIRDVVITVPAYFGVNQKEATRQAGELAGLNVLYVIPEPTAAAIAYGLEQEEDQVVMVYDLGGGTFDVTVIAVEKEAVTVICTGGDHQLGGKNWDEAVAGYFAQRFEEEKGTPADELLNDRETYQELLKMAESRKQALTDRTSVVDRVYYEEDRCNVELTREKFEEITAGFLERTVSLTEELLETAGSKGHERIDKLLLVGGSTYMLQVSSALEKRFSFPISLFDPNQSVAKGAALFGFKCYLDEAVKVRIADSSGQEAEAVDLDQVSDETLGKAQREVAAAHGLALPGMQRLTETAITNVTSKSFGVVVLTDGGEERVCNLIIADDSVPKTVSREFQTAVDGQLGVEIRCVENTERVADEETIPFDPDQVIGTAEIEFERPLPKGSPVEISFNLAEDGLLSVHGRDQTTHREIDTDFKTESLLSEEELEQAKRRNRAIAVS